jgi:hypothetical protein
MAGKAARPSTLMHRLASSPAPIEQPAPKVEDEHETLTPEPVMTRLSVDLDDAQFEFLSIFAMRRKVSKVEIMRALMTELQADAALAERVSGRLPTRRRK